MTSIDTLRQWVQDAQHIVFFGGAGVSTESGIPDFRSQDGLYHQTYAYPPETILSHTFFQRHPAEFFTFYRDKMLPLEAQPNAAHQALSHWEREGKLLAVITQNIDGLHQKAGSHAVYELHGSIWRNHCLRCGRSFDPTNQTTRKTDISLSSKGSLIVLTIRLIAERLGGCIGCVLCRLCYRHTLATLPY